MSDAQRTLDQLTIGQVATVTALDITGANRRRMLDLGILPGTIIEAMMVSPLGDPTAYLVRGALVALRREQAQHITVTLVDTHPEKETSS